MARKYLDPLMFAGMVHHSVEIMTKDDIDSEKKCDGSMLFAEHINVSCTEQRLINLEPLRITVDYRNMIPGSMNYEVKVQVHYEPDASDKLHVWIKEDVFKPDENGKYLTDIPDYIFNIIQQTIPPEKEICGGYVTFCSIETNLIGFTNQALRAIVEGIVGMIQIDLQAVSQDDIVALFKAPRLG